MKLRFQSTPQRGTALLVVMALLVIMSVFMVCTAQSIFFVKRELKLIEKKQLQRYETKAAPGARP